MKSLINRWSIVLTIVALAIFCSVKTNAATMVDSGSCGDDVSWELDDEGTLTISGTGAIANYSVTSKAPWYEKYVQPYLEEEQGEIIKVVIAEGVTGIGDYAFYNFQHAVSIDIPESAIQIGEHSFSHCETLQDITISKYTTKLGSYAFEACHSLKTFNSSLSVGGMNIVKYVFKDCDKIK